MRNQRGSFFASSSVVCRPRRLRRCVATRVPPKQHHHCSQRLVSRWTRSSGRSQIPPVVLQRVRRLAPSFAHFGRVVLRSAVRWSGRSSNIPLDLAESRQLARSRHAGCPTAGFGSRDSRSSRDSGSAGLNRSSRIRAGRSVSECERHARAAARAPTPSASALANQKATEREEHGAQVGSPRSHALGPRRRRSDLGISTTGARGGGQSSLISRLSRARGLLRSCGRRCCSRSDRQRLCPRSGSSKGPSQSELPRCWDHGRRARRTLDQERVDVTTFVTSQGLRTKPSMMSKPTAPSPSINASREPLQSAQTPEQPIRRRIGSHRLASGPMTLAIEWPHDACDWQLSGSARSRGALPSGARRLTARGPRWWSLHPRHRG